MSSFFKSFGVGGSLSGFDRRRSDEIKDTIDKTSNHRLTASDWKLNLACVDLINSSETKPEVVVETILHIRKKITARSLQTILLTLHLLDYLVNNCGAKFHSALDNEPFLTDLGKVASKFIRRNDSEHEQVALVALELIKAWGEAFLPIQSEYPNIPKLFFDLKKSGLPFSSAPYDPLRVTIYDSNGSYRYNIRQSYVGVRYQTDNENDSVIAAAMAGRPPIPNKPNPASNIIQNVNNMNFFSGPYSRHAGPTNTPTPYNNSYINHSNPTATNNSYRVSLSNHSADSIDPDLILRKHANSMDNSISQTQMESIAIDRNSVPRGDNYAIQLKNLSILLKDIVLVSQSEHELRTNDIARTVSQQLHTLKDNLPNHIEREYLNNSEGLNKLLVFNSSLQKLLKHYRMVCNFKSSLDKAQIAALALETVLNEEGNITTSRIRINSLDTAESHIPYELTVEQTERKGIATHNNSKLNIYRTISRKFSQNKQSSATHMAESDGNLFDYDSIYSDNHVAADTGFKETQSISSNLSSNHDVVSANGSIHNSNGRVTDQFDGNDVNNPRFDNTSVSNNSYNAMKSKEKVFGIGYKQDDSFDGNDTNLRTAIDSSSGKIGKSPMFSGKWLKKFIGIYSKDDTNYQSPRSKSRLSIFRQSSASSPSNFQNQSTMGSNSKPRNNGSIYKQIKNNVHQYRLEDEYNRDSSSELFRNDVNPADMEELFDQIREFDEEDSVTIAKDEIFHRSSDDMIGFKTKSFELKSIQSRNEFNNNSNSNSNHSKSHVEEAIQCLRRGSNSSSNDEVAPINVHRNEVTKTDGNNPIVIKDKSEKLRTDGLIATEDVQDRSVETKQTQSAQPRSNSVNWSHLRPGNERSLMSNGPMETENNFQDDENDDATMSRLSVISDLTEVTAQFYSSQNNNMNPNAYPGHIPGSYPWQSLAHHSPRNNLQQPQGLHLHNNNNLMTRKYVPGGQIRINQLYCESIAQSNHSPTQNQHGGWSNDRNTTYDNNAYSQNRNQVYPDNTYQQSQSHQHYKPLTVMRSEVDTRVPLNRTQSSSFAHLPLTSHIQVQGPLVNDNDHPVSMTSSQVSGFMPVIADDNNGNGTPSNGSFSNGLSSSGSNRSQSNKEKISYQQKNVNSSTPNQNTNVHIHHAIRANYLQEQKMRNDSPIEIFEIPSSVSVPDYDKDLSHSQSPHLNHNYARLPSPHRPPNIPKLNRQTSEEKVPLNLASAGNRFPNNGNERDYPIIFNDSRDCNYESNNIRAKSPHNLLKTQSIQPSAVMNPQQKQSPRTMRIAQHLGDTTLSSNSNANKNNSTNNYNGMNHDRHSHGNNSNSSGSHNSHSGVAHSTGIASTTSGSITEDRMHYSNTSNRSDIMRVNSLTLSEGGNTDHSLDDWKQTQRYQQGYADPTALIGNNNNYNHFQPTRPPHNLDEFLVNSSGTQPYVIPNDNSLSDLTNRPEHTGYEEHNHHSYQALALAVGVNQINQHSSPNRSISSSSARVGMKPPPMMKPIQVTINNDSYSQSTVDDTGNSSSNNNSNSNSNGSNSRKHLYGQGGRRMNNNHIIADVPHAPIRSSHRHRLVVSSTLLYLIRERGSLGMTDGST
eukprot:gene6122-8438_t